MNPRRVDLVFLVLTTAYALTTLIVSSLVVAGLQDHRDDAMRVVRRFNTESEKNYELIQEATANLRHAQSLFASVQQMLALATANKAASAPAVRTAQQSIMQAAEQSFARSLGTLADMTGVDGARRAVIDEMIAEAGSEAFETTAVVAEIYRLQAEYRAQQMIAIASRDERLQESEALQREIDRVQSVALALQFLMILAVFAKDWWKERRPAAGAAATA